MNTDIALMRQGSYVGLRSCIGFSLGEGSQRPGSAGAPAVSSLMHFSSVAPTGPLRLDANAAGAPHPAVPTRRSARNLRKQPCETLLQVQQSFVKGSRWSPGAVGRPSSLPRHRAARGARLGCLQLAFVLLGCLGQAQAPLDLGLQRQLFVDGTVVGALSNAWLHVNPIQKVGRPLVSPDEPWEGTALQFGGVVRDPADGVFKMWYSAFAIAASGKAPGWRQCYAESNDGVHWRKPDLGLVDFQGSKHNNLVAFSRSEYFSTPLGYVMLDPRPAEQARRFKSFAMVSGGYGVLSSADGKTWVPYAQNPVCDATGDVAPTLFDERKNQFVSFMKLSATVAGRARRAVGRRTSPDLVHWTPNRAVLVPDAWEDERAKVMMATRKGWMEYYGMIGFPYADTYLGLVWSFFCNAEPVGTTEGVFQVELTTSPDGETWSHAADRAPVIERGTPGSFDGGMVFTAARPLVIGDELWVYYCGWESTHGSYWYEEPQTDEPLKRGFISAGTLRRDGWVSVDARFREGQVTTKPLRFLGKQLSVNADAREGTVRVAVLDASGQEMPGFAAADALPLERRSDLGWTATWSGQPELSRLQSQPIRLKFILNNAKLYSFQFQQK